MSAAPRMLYLDTNDVSHLVKGRGPGGPERVGQQRDELRQMIEDGRVRLLVSFIHLAEMALDDETREGGRAWLRMLPEVWCFTTPVDDIFRAELRNQALRIEAIRLYPALDALLVPSRLGVAARGGQVAWFMKSLSRLCAAAERHSRNADRRARADRTKPENDRHLGTRSPHRGS
ncbi:MAG: hypothetical protein KF901_13180 [Myxococcales bacterium]|nr:hypothetical protein [Myxococcales bacterium]